MIFHKIKNPTPQLIAISSSAVIALSCGMLLFILDILGWLSLVWYGYPLLMVLLFGLIYYVFSFLIEKYIYRKIKLLYKFVRDTKLKPSERTPRTLDLSKDIFQDVAENMQSWASHQIAEIENLQKMELARTEFISNVSHELKTPLFSIQGYVETLLDGGLKDNKVNMLYLERTARNVERLISMLQDLDFVSHLDSRDMHLEMELFDLRQLADEVMKDLEIKAVQKKIRLQFKEGTADPYKVFADRDAIRQVFTNLISNALKYGKPQGEVQISFYDMDTTILVEVSDDGLGISKEHLQHIFDRFYRVDKTRTRNPASGGAGLGLAIVKHIIEAHQQTINVRSTLGVGSTFAFTLARKTGA